MNEPLFDIRANLTPYSITDASLDDVEKWFVLPFDQTSTRHKLIIEYKRYVEDLKDAIGFPFYQWLNGSFIRNIESPNDIDLVTFVDDETYQAHQILINNRFSKWSANSFYSNIDAYIVRTYPPNHRNFLTFQADLAYWYDCFGKTRRDRNRKRYSKGFIQITID